MHDSCCDNKKETKCCSGTLAGVGHWMFAVPMFIFGVFHFLKGPDMAGVLAGWPFALFLVYVSGAGLILGAVAIVLNRYARLAATLLAVELGIFVLALHLPGVIAGGASAQMSTMSALKDLALVGGALVIASHMMNRGFSSK